MASRSKIFTTLVGASLVLGVLSSPAPAPAPGLQLQCKAVETQEPRMILVPSTSSYSPMSSLGSFGSLGSLGSLGSVGLGSIGTVGECTKETIAVPIGKVSPPATTVQYAVPSTSVVAAAPAAAAPTVSYVAPAAPATTTLQVATAPAAVESSYDIITPAAAPTASVASYVLAPAAAPAVQYAIPAATQAISQPTVYYSNSYGSPIGTSSFIKAPSMMDYIGTSAYNSYRNLDTMRFPLRHCSDGVRVRQGLFRPAGRTTGLSGRSLKNCACKCSTHH